MKRCVLALEVVASMLMASCGAAGLGSSVDQPPTLSFQSPTSDVEVAIGSGEVVTIIYTDDDPDSIAATDLLADQDDDLDTTGDQVVIDLSRPDQNGVQQNVLWPLTSVPAGTYKIYARTHDATTTVVGSAPAHIVVSGGFLNLGSDVAVSRGASVEIRYADDDLGQTWLYADRDGNLDTPSDSIMITLLAPQLSGSPQSVSWDTTGAPFGHYTIMSFTWDGTNPPAIRTAVGGVDVQNISFAALAVATEARVSAVPDGTSVVVGYYFADATFGAGEANETLLALSGGTADAFVARYETDGRLRWAKRITGAGSQEAFGVVALPDGSSIVTGVFEGTATFGTDEPGVTTVTGLGYDLFLAKYNADGTFAWVKQAGGSVWDSGRDASGKGIAMFPDGGIALTGEYGGPAIFGPGEANQTTLPQGSGVFVAKFTAAGTLVWAKGTGGPGDTGYSVDTFPDGTCAITGRFGGTITFGAGEANQSTLRCRGTSGAFVAKYNADGTLAWAKQQGDQDDQDGLLGEAKGSDISCFADGTCVVSGDFTNEADFGYGEANETSFSAVGDYDAFVARFNSDGTLAWAVQQGGVGQDGARAVEALADGSCVLAGSFMATAGFGLGEPNETFLSAQSTYEMYIARLAADGALRWVHQAGGSSYLTVPGGLTLFDDGSFGVTGMFGNGSVTFGAGDERASEITASTAAIFLARYNADGGF